jgi:hypothetical protein
VGRRWNLDPVPQIGLSDYACFNNSPINLSDVDGDDPGKPGKKSNRYDWSAALRYQAIHYNGARVAYNIYRARQTFGHYGTKYNDSYKEQISSRAAKSFQEQNMVVTGIDPAAYAKVIEGYYESFEKGFNWAGDKTMRELKFIFDNKYYTDEARYIFKSNLTTKEANLGIKASTMLLDDLKGAAYTIGEWGEEVFMKCAMFTAAWTTSAAGSGVMFSSVVVPGIQPNRTPKRMFPQMATNGGLKPLGLGSTAKAGVSRVTPVNLTEELTMKEIMSNPSMGRIMDGLKKGMTDKRWHKDNGWVKMSWNNGGVEIHYAGQWQNGVLKAVDDFKIIGQ